MKKITKLLSVFVIAGAVSASLGSVAGCGHKHTYSEDWSTDATQHWHAATCEHTDEKSDLGNHVDEDNDGKCDVCDYTLAPASVAVTGVTLNVTSKSLSVGGEFTLTATVAPSNATNKSVIWTSSNVNVATVDQSGKVTAVGAGTANIKVTTVDGNFTAQCAVTVISEEDLFEIPVAADGIVVTGITTRHDLSETYTSANIDLSNVEVKFATNGVSFGDAISSDNYTLSVYDASDLTPIGASELAAVTKDGDYSILVELVNVKLASGSTASLDDFYAEVTVKVNNPVTAVAVKAGGTFTQVQSTTDNMTPTWQFEATRANGDKEDVAASQVTVGSIDTTTVGTRTVTLTYGGEVLGSVEYTISEDVNKVSQSFALNFSFLTSEQEASIAAGNLVSFQEGRFEVISKSSGEIADHNKSIDGKYFAKRLKVNGASTASGAPRYIKVHADGPATLTVYAYNNSTSTGRGVSLYSACDSSGSAYVFTGKIGETAIPDPKTDTKIEYQIPAAGDYYITCDAAMTFTYVQLDQLVSSDGNSAITLGGTVQVSKISASYSGEGTQEVALGTTWDSIKSSYTVMATGVNDVSCDSVDVPVDLANVQFTVPDDFTTAYGEKTITAAYEGKTTTIKVIVDSAVTGIYGVTAKLGDTVDTQVASSTAKFTLKKEDVVFELLGENANAQTSYTVTYNGTEIDSNGTEFAVSDTAYEVTVAVTVTDGTQSATLTTTVTFTVSVASTSATQSFISPDTLPATTAVAKDAIITENNLFKVVADDDMEYSAGTTASSGIQNASKPVTVTLQDGTTKTLMSGIRTAKSAFTEGASSSDPTTSVTITAKQKITIRIYVICCNDGYNSNKAGKIWYSIDGAAATSVASGSNRQVPTVITLELDANSKVTFYATGDAEGVRMYLFGVEATAATTASATSVVAVAGKQQEEDQGEGQTTTL